MWFNLRNLDLFKMVVKENIGILSWIALIVFVIVLVTVQPGKELEASTSDDMLYRKSVEAQVDSAKALQSIAESMRKLVDKQGDSTPVTCHGAKGPMEIQCPKGCSAEQCIKLFSCEMPEKKWLIP